MSNLKSFPAPGGAGANVIERLEEALAMAKQGHIANVLMVMVDTDDNVYHGWANGNRPTLIIGEAYCAMQALSEAVVQRRGQS